MTLVTTTTSLSDLVNAMRGTASTNKWDVVCSYSIAQLNVFLAAQYNAGTLAKEVRVSVDTTDPVTEEPYTANYDLFFGSPTLSFIAGRSGMATLTMPIEQHSSYTITTATRPPRTVPIPGGQYSIQAIVPLAAIAGDTGAVSQAGDILTFSQGDPTTAHIILHFKNQSGTTFSVQPPPGPNDKTPLDILLLPLLVEYFQTEVSEIDYALTAVNNQQPSSGDVTLTPKSFVFASYGTDANGILSIYIQTVGSGNPPGNPNPSFQPGDTEIAPIPSDYSASLIISYDVITQQYLKTQLQNNGFDVSFPVTTNGIQAELTSSKSVVGSSENGTVWLSSWSYDGLDISLSKYPMTMTIEDSNVSLSWQGRATSEWSKTASGMGSTVVSWGKVGVTITLNKAVPIGSPTSDNLDIAAISVSESDFKISTKSHSCTFAQRLEGCSQSTPDYYEHDMKLTIPPINLSIPNLNFLATTNLLSPSQHVISIDAKAGVLTPHDFLLVGNIIQQAS
jgi:hypothetical protein